METQLPDKRIVNCHTHIFTGDSVPRWLAKGVAPWPLHYLLPIDFFVKLVRFWQRRVMDWYYKKKREGSFQIFYRVKMFLRRTWLLNIVQRLFEIILLAHALYFIVAVFSRLIAPDNVSLINWIQRFHDWMVRYHVFPANPSLGTSVCLLMLLIILFPTSRNLLFFILGRIWKMLGAIPGRNIRALLDRYLLIVRYAQYKNQGEILKRLKWQYPQGTAFVVLPMDMAYMDAGPVARPYEEQIKELAELKTNYKDQLHPFIFAHPQRIAEDKNQLKYRMENGRVMLEDCFFKTYLEGENKFSGIKIYPALGYYPFDSNLLPLWLYAVQNNIPIMTHCSRGVIYYRGNKKAEWDYHPIFKQHYNPEEGILMTQIKPHEFTGNFTHPLNYLCLLNEELLRKVVAQSNSDEIKKLFGYTDYATPLERNLSKLKICLAHFGGEDEWPKFMEADRDKYSQLLIKYPDFGIDFMRNNDKEFSHAKMEEIWRDTDWYSIICSLMLQYDNVYADISYNLHDNNLLPLLKQTLCNPKLRKKVLFGTDFYVVRNHKSDKNMVADLYAGLDRWEFNQIAICNPEFYLK